MISFMHWISTMVPNPRWIDVTGNWIFDVSEKLASSAYNYGPK
jgi:hypothetical protein